MMARYAEVDSTFPGRIMIMAEREQHWRLKTASKIVEAETFAVRVGALTVPAISTLALGFAAWAAYTGRSHWWIAVAVLPTFLMALGRVIAQVRNPQPGSERELTPPPSAQDEAGRLIRATLGRLTAGRLNARPGRRP